jgi:hypothetical protein
LLLAKLPQCPIFQLEIPTTEVDRSKGHTGEETGAGTLKVVTMSAHAWHLPWRTVFLEVSCWFLLENTVSVSVYGDSSHPTLSCISPEVMETGWVEALKLLSAGRVWRNKGPGRSSEFCSI